MGSVRYLSLFIAGSLAWGFPAVAFCQDDGIRALVGSLGSEEFKERTKAQGELSRWASERPDIGRDWLFQEFEASGDPEVRIRLREVLKEVVVAEHQKDGPGYVGISMMDVEVPVPGEEGMKTGVSVTRVQENTPASRAGLQAGDVVIAVDNLQWSNEAATPRFQEAIMKHKPGDTVELRILRGAELMKVPVTLAPRPMGLPEVSAIQAFQGAPGVRFNFMRQGDEELKAMDEKMKDDEKKAKEDCFEAWLEQRRSGAGKP